MRTIEQMGLAGHLTGGQARQTPATAPVGLPSGRLSVTQARAFVAADSPPAPAARASAKKTAKLPVATADQRGLAPGVYRLPTGKILVVGVAEGHRFVRKVRNRKADAKATDDVEMAAHRDMRARRRTAGKEVR